MTPALFIRTLKRSGTTYTRAIVIDHTQCGTADSSNITIPVLLQLNDLKTLANGGKVQNSNGYDITFSIDAAGTSLLSWQMTNYNGSTGNIYAFVQMPTISYTADTVFYMHYGSTGITSFMGGNPWASAYQTVWHLDEGTNPYNDSTTNANNSIASDNPTPTFGKIYTAQAFNGTSNYIDFGTGASLDQGSNITISFWFKLVSTPGANAYIFSKGTGTRGATAQYEFYIDTSRQGNFACDGTAGPATAAFTIDTWYHIAIICNGSGTKIYINGSTSGGFTVPLPGTANARSMVVGAQTGSTGFVNAIIDELEIYNAIWSTSTITTIYNAQNNNSSFLTVGAEI